MNQWKKHVHVLSLPKAQLPRRNCGRTGFSCCFLFHLLVPLRKTCFGHSASINSQHEKPYQKHEKAIYKIIIKIHFLINFLWYRKHRWISELYILSDGYLPPPLFVEVVVLVQPAQRAREPVQAAQQAPARGSPVLVPDGRVKTYSQRSYGKSRIVAPFP